MKVSYDKSALRADLRDDLRALGGSSRLGQLRARWCTMYRVIQAHRISRYLYQFHSPWATFRCNRLLGWMHSRPCCYLSPLARLGRRIRFPHPVGVVIGAGVEVGDDVTIFQHVTLGSHGEGGADEARGHPTIGHGTIIYAGAVVIGNIRIGDNCIIGANAVVNRDIPDNSVAVGVPAKVIKQRDADAAPG